jgi:patatin-like phospholipase/acyl hydrolase
VDDDIQGGYVTENNSRRSDGTLQGLREPLAWPENKPFRILSIDGGGVRGILPAKVLAEFERRYLNGASIGNYFDLIAGTSTGGIIALALATGLPASQILDLYVCHGEDVFPAPKWHVWAGRGAARLFWELGHYRYRREPLEALLRQIFGNKLLGEAQRRLCVPSFDGFTEVHVFKTPHHPDFRKDWREDMISVALATAAAPTFFPVYSNSGRHFADGGVWANDPVMIALVDALSAHMLARRSVHVLSLGCGDAEMVMSRGQIRGGGLWHWRKIIAAAMHLQSQTAIGQAGLLIGRDQLIRINGNQQAGTIEMDDFRRARDELPAMGSELADRFGGVVRERFLLEEAAPYQAFFGPRRKA